MKNLILVLFSLFVIHSEAQATAVKTVFICNSSSVNVAQLYIELFADEAGKLSSRYTLGSNPLYYPSWTTAGKITSPPARLPRVLTEINARRDTGINPANVKRFQNIFIDGSNTWAIELWKLMDSSEKVVGWMATAYGEVFGCY